jgi:hypothetical protein
MYASTFDHFLVCVLVEGFANSSVRYLCVQWSRPKYMIFAILYELGTRSMELIPTLVCMKVKIWCIVCLLTYRAG